MKLPSKVLTFFLFPGLVFLIHLSLSKIFHLYEVFPHMDIPFHYIGGLSIAYTAGKTLMYLEKENLIAKLNRVIFLILPLTLTATAAVFWEFGEFLLDRWMHTNIQISLENTMQDQFFGVLGGLTIVATYHRSFFKKKLNRIS